MQYQRYFAFLRYAIDSERQSVPSINYDEWRKLFKFAEEQAISALLFEGAKRLGEQGVKPPFNVLMEWIAFSEQITGQNRSLNNRSFEVIKELEEQGFYCCLLKGQGNALMYPNPYSRTPGDIDIWVRPKRGINKQKDVRRHVTEWVEKNKKGSVELRYYHVGYREKGVEVELHFMPGIMNNPIYNRRLQKYYCKIADKGCVMAELPDVVGSIPLPTPEFNVVFQLAHMMHHFFDEGIGLRQFVDYYFVLKVQKDRRWKMENGRETLRYLGLWKFAGAVMYIMGEVFHLEDKFMIAPVDEKRGKLLMEEILKGGNFGRKSRLTKLSVGRKYFAKTWRNVQLVREYPAEAVCEPFFRTWHYLWRVLNR